VLTQESFQDRLTSFAIKTICVSSAICASHLLSEDNPAYPVQPDNLVYAIYTSGSTGKPKGVMNTHRGICNRLLWMQDTYQLTQEDRVLQKTPFGFDVSVWEFFWSLLTGARLIIARPGGHFDPSYLRTLIAEQQVTILHFVPSMLQAFLWDEPAGEIPHLENCRSLRRVICSGEALSVELQARFFARVAEDVELHNLYGPTEAAIDVTFWQCQSGSQDTLVPIGCPIANTQIYLLDSNLSPVPVGVPGELYIGGEGLARGYWRRPDLTAERFVPHPFVGTGSEPCTIPTGPHLGERLYRTGDLARYRPDGTIEYLGRVDHQIKLRGHRIELEEIEAVVSQHPDVRECVVVLRDEDEIGKYLVAYVVPMTGAGSESSTAPTVSALQAYLRQHLPDYMVPPSVIFLETLPLTPNGKVDRKALPVPERSRVLEGTEMVAPQTPLQEQLALIWAGLLHVSQVGIHDNFFELGGHSLLATQLMARLRTQFQVEIPLRSLFEKPTIAEMALAIEQMQHEILRQTENEVLAQMLIKMGGLSEDEMQAIFTDDLNV
jgi:amino acid adenylation domain-containing protein